MKRLLFTGKAGFGPAESWWE